MILERMKQAPHLVAIVDYVGEEPIYVVEPLQFIEVIYCLGDRVHKIAKKPFHHGNGSADAMERIALERHK